MCHLVTFSREDRDVMENLSTRILIAKARSDNTDLFCNFADKIKAISLQDEVHSHGNIDNVLVTWFYRQDLTARLSSHARYISMLSDVTQQ